MESGRAWGVRAWRVAGHGVSAEVGVEHSTVYLDKAPSVEGGRVLVLSGQVLG